MNNEEGLVTLLSRTRAFAEVVSAGFDNSIHDLAATPTDISATISVGQPPLRLFPHQSEGVRWLEALYINSVSGILADDMGLGKTVQVAVFLQRLFGVHGIGGLHIIVAPVATLPHWTRELSRWAPGLTIVQYHGTVDERNVLRREVRKAMAQDACIVFVTSYQTLMRDTRYLKRKSWGVLVVDEAHRLKNANCKLLAIVKTFITDMRLLLTGTPLQNNVRELWSILNFVYPQVFSSVEEGFASWFALGKAAAGGTVTGEGDRSRRKRQRDASSTAVVASPTVEVSCSSRGVVQQGSASMTDLGEDEKIDDDQRGASSSDDTDREVDSDDDNDDGVEPRNVDDVVIQMHKVLRPFMLRRRKEDHTEVLRLTQKKELVVHCPLSHVQRQMYAAIVSGGKDGLNNPLMQLRKVCNHPWLFRPRGSGNQPPVARGGVVMRQLSSLAVSADLEKDCGKIRVLKKLLQATLFTNKNKQNGASSEGVRTCPAGTRSTVEGQAPQQPATTLSCRTRHRVLIFSQMVRILEIISDFLDSCVFDVAGSGGKNSDDGLVRYVMFHGSMALDEREEAIREFQDENSDVQVMLVSTRAGGVGLNLTRADTVILYDSDYNPYNDKQAIDRCHRIGQNHNVVVYRLVVQQSVETLILDAARKKLEVEHLFLNTRPLVTSGSEGRQSQHTGSQPASTEELGTEQDVRGDDDAHWRAVVARERSLLDKVFATPVADASQLVASPECSPNLRPVGHPSVVSAGSTAGATIAGGTSSLGDGALTNDGSTATLLDAIVDRDSLFGPTG